jgi:RNA polymerase sigma-70 factor, ECF subfamily
VDELTASARAAGWGDRAALIAFVRASQPDVWRLCAHLASRGEADDLTQETYARALRTLPRFRGDSSARTWLLAIARRTVADAIRSSRRRRRLADQLRHPSQPAADPSASYEVQAALDTLDDDRRTAFVLTQVMGLTYAETAEVCGCAVGTIRSRVARAREALVDALEHAEADSR